MPTPHWCSTRIITFVSLVALSVLSLAVIFGTGTSVDTQPQRDSLFSYPKPNTPHHPRAFRHARLPFPAIPSISNDPNSQDTSPSTPATPNTPQQVPSPSQPAPSPSTPANSQDSSPSLAPASQSPSPSPSASSPSPSSPPPRTLGSSTAPAVSPTSAPSVAPSQSSPSLGPAAPSSQGVTGSPAAPIINTGNNPATTFRYTPASNTPDSHGTVRPVSSSIIYASATATGAPSGFLAHKGTVGVTFTLVGLVSALGIWLAVLRIQRRRHRARARQARREFYEKTRAEKRHRSVIPASPTLPTFGDVATEDPLRPSTTDVSMMPPAPSHAYPERVVHYGQPPPGSYLRPTDYGIAYPPGDTFTPAAAGGDASAHYGAPSAGDPFGDPANASHMPAPPPVSYQRPIPGRAQEMVEVDSYYGNNGAGVGTGYAQ